MQYALVYAEDKLTDVARSDQTVASPDLLPTALLTEIKLPTTVPTCHAAEFWWLISGR